MLMKQKKTELSGRRPPDSFSMQSYLSVRISPCPWVFRLCRDVDVPTFDSAATARFYWLDVLRLSLGIPLAEHLNQNS